MRPEPLAQNPSWIANKQRTIVVNIHQDFVARMHSDFLQG
jgi:hypothetical protein